MSDFSLDLNEDQLQMQKWVHDFAENVIRPVAARVRREGRDALAGHPGGGQHRPVLPGGHGELLQRPDRAHLPGHQRGADLGLRRHRARDLRHHPRRLRHPRQRHARADRRVGPAVLRHPGRRSTSRRSRSPSPTPAPTSSSLRTRAVYDEAKDEWVINGVKTWITNGGIDKVPTVHVVVAVGRARAQGARPRELRRPAGHARPEDGPEVQEDGHPGQPHRRGHPRRRARPRLLPPRRQGEARRALRPRPRGQEQPRAGRDEHVRGEPPARRRAGARHRAGRVRVLARLRQGAQGVRPGDHREPGDRVQARRHEDGDRRAPACSCGGRAGWRATASSSSPARAR